MHEFSFDFFFLSFLIESCFFFGKMRAQFGITQYLKSLEISQKIKKKLFFEVTNLSDCHREMLKKIKH